MQKNCCDLFILTKSAATRYRITTYVVNDVVRNGITTVTIFLFGGIEIYVQALSTSPGLICTSTKLVKLQKHQQSGYGAKAGQVGTQKRVVLEHCYPKVRFESGTKHLTFANISHLLPLIFLHILLLQSEICNLQYLTFE